MTCTRELYEKHDSSFKKIEKDISIFLKDAYNNERNPKLYYTYED